MRATYTPKFRNEFAMGTSYCTIWQWMLVREPFTKAHKFTLEQMGISFKAMPLPTVDPLTKYDWRGQP